MKKITLLILISIFLLSCDEQEQHITNDISISGNFTNLKEGNQIYLDFLTPQQFLTLDTAIVDGNGDYSFTYPIENLGYYRLRINNQNFISLVLDPGEKPTVNGDGGNLMDSYFVEGSPESNKWKEFNIAYKKDAFIQDSINKVFQANRNNQSVFIELQKASITSINNRNNTFINIINENPTSLVSLYAVQQLDHKVYGELYKKVDEAMDKSFKNNPWFTDFHNRVAKMVNLIVGEPAPDFTLNDKDGNPISLSSLKGKVVLLDFWASWCKPCRAENPNVVKLYHKYKKKGFTVMSVSLDGMAQQQDAKQDWLNAIEKDGLVWKNHVSDFKGWKSEPLPLYGVEGIPFTVLIDKEGMMIGINLKGENLENKLIEIFK
jgi:thiol-disulfide isomerase/thioredoxin